MIYLWLGGAALVCVLGFAAGVAIGEWWTERRYDHLRPDEETG